MADDSKSKQKTKIDLKARLGKTQTGMGAAPVPVPTPGSQPGSGPPGAPAATSNSPSGRPSAPQAQGIAPPPGISPGIPLPPFAQQRPAQAQPAPKPTAVQQTIKVEVGEEIEQERKRMGKRAALYAGIAAVVGITLGFFAGGAKERGDRGKQAIEGAALLEKDVKAANDKMKELNEKLGAAATALGNKNFPKEFAQELAAINIPFDATTLEGKSVGSLPGRTLKALFHYTQAVANLNETKDSLRNLLGIAQAPVEKAWKEEKEPVLNFSVVFRKDGEKTVAELVPNKEPFPFAGNWPEKYKITRLERGPQGAKPVEKDAVRWSKGELVATDPQAIPVDPPSVAQFTSEQIVFRLAKEIRDLRQALEGNNEDPNAPTALLKQGDDLANDLHKVAIAR